MTTPVVDQPLVRPRRSSPAAWPDVDPRTDGEGPPASEGAVGSRSLARRIGVLLAGRTVLRTTIGLSPLVLKLGWDAANFDRYAAAMARFVLVVPLLSSGIEKSLLKQVVRSRRARPQLTAVYLLLAAVVATGISAYVVAVASWSTNVALVVLAGGFSLLLALLQITVGLHRALGRPWIDAAAHTCAGLAIASLVGVASVDGWSPVALLTGMVSVVGALVVLVTLRLLAVTPLARPRRSVARLVLWDSSLLGVTDVIAGIVVTSLLALATVVAGRAQLAALYVALNLASLLTSGYTYLLRVIQPEASRRLRDPDAGAVFHPSGRRATTLLVGSAGWTALVAIAAHLAAGRFPATAVCVGVFVACTPLITAVAAWHFVFENRGAHQLRRTVIGAAAGGVVALALAAPLIAMLDAAGAIVALTIGEWMHLAVLVTAPPPTATRR